MTSDDFNSQKVELQLCIDGNCDLHNTSTLVESCEAKAWRSWFRVLTTTTQAEARQINFHAHPTVGEPSAQSVSKLECLFNTPLM